MNHVPMEPLSTARLHLRKIRMEDAQTYFERIGCREEVTRGMMWDPHRSVADSIASMEKALAGYREGKCYKWGACLADDRIIGIIDLLRFDEERNTCSFAYMLCPEYHRRGYGTEMLRAVLGFAFERLGVSAVEADHFTDNPASGAVMRKAGMKRVAHTPGKYEKHGVLHDADSYRITREQWEEQK